ncbi:uncharacterized protein LOC141902905 [Tubulanus polymorphus]|uniref:uncharacterized protein LOC141902905 n=1 Tax=Tubulanus polymorphus TaxID=672921 RepID=UPI003DA390A9
MDYFSQAKTVGGGGGGVRAAFGPMVFFANHPNLASLLTISLTINNAKKSPSPKLQPQVIKCRELIFTEPDIIASPELGDENRIYLIMQRKLYETGRLQAKFQKMSLDASKPLPVIAACYKTCLMYTLLAKLAPNWNKVGSLLVQGRDFMNYSQKLAAIKMDMNINSSELYLSLDAAVIRLPLISIEDLEICRPVLDEFFQNENGTIHEYSIDRQWCHVLPSMKKGQVVKVVRQLPADCPYKSYKDLKRHWKNFYGYRLPEVECSYYLQVYFQPLPDKLFTYPVYCIRQRDVIHFPRQNPHSIIQAFLRDLHQRVPTVCGIEMTFKPRGQFLTNTLNQACSDNVTVNMTPKPPLVGLPVTVNRSVSVPVFETRTKGFISQTAAFRERPGVDNRTNEVGKLHTSLQRSASEGEVGTHQPVPTVGSNRPDPGSFLASQTDRSRTGGYLGQGGYYKSNRIVNTAESRVNPAVIPCNYHPLQPGPRENNDDISTENESSARKIQRGMDIKASRENGPSIIQNQTRDQNLSASQKMIPKFRPAIKMSIRVKPRQEAKRIIPQFKTVKKPNPTVTTCVPGVQIGVQGKLQSRSDISIRERPAAENVDHRNNRSKEVTQETASMKQIVDEMFVGMQQTSAIKRMADSTSDGCSKPPAAKKPRQKPVIDSSIDVKHLANNHQLNKVNTATLVAWMKEQGIVYKSKDKKADLMNKVNEFLNIKASEQ